MLALQRPVVALCSMTAIPCWKSALSLFQMKELSIRLSLSLYTHSISGLFSNHHFWSARVPYSWYSDVVSFVLQPLESSRYMLSGMPFNFAVLTLLDGCSHKKRTLTITLQYTSESSSLTACCSCGQ